MDFTNRAAVTKAVMDFIYELPEGYSNFPEHVLKLISKHFNQHSLTFIPTCQSYSTLRKLRPDHFVQDYVALNIDRQCLKDYNRYYHAKDIFRYNGLPAEIRRKPVLQIEDIMSYEQFRQTEHYLFFQRYNTAYEAVINLSHQDTYLGAIGIYHSNDEGSFTPEQISVFETLNRFIVQHYLGAMEASRRSFLLGMFSSGFQDLSLGVVALDEKYTVLEANATAQLYAQAMLKSDNTDYVQRTAQGETSQYPAVQQIINNLGSSLFHRRGPVEHSSGTCCYQFHTTRMDSPSRNLIKIETLYLVYISVAESQAEANKELLSDLTARETEIVEYIAKGYTNTQIAEEMHISVHTVKTHILNVFKKQGVNSRTALLHKLMGSRTY